jgi:ribonuclease T2
MMAGLGAFALMMMGLGLAGCKSGSSTLGGPVATRQPDVAPRTTVAANDSAEQVPEQRPEQRTGRRRTRRGRAQEQATPGQFDFYLLNLSWSPEFCATHSSPECGKGLGFVVHGLWPQDTTGDYPEDCSDAPGPVNPGVDTDIYPTASLVEHEWQTHGTCSGLSADGYFAAVHTAFAEVKTPHLAGGSETPAALLEQLQGMNPGFPVGSFAVSCGNNELTAIEVCLDKALKPEACQGVRSCGANTVKITAQ